MDTKQDEIVEELKNVTLFVIDEIIKIAAAKNGRITLDELVEFRADVIDRIEQENNHATQAR